MLHGNTRHYGFRFVGFKEHNDELMMICKMNLVELIENVLNELFNFRLFIKTMGAVQLRLSISQTVHL